MHYEHHRSKVRNDSYVGCWHMNVQVKRRSMKQTYLFNQTTLSDILPLLVLQSISGITNYAVIMLTNQHKGLLIKLHGGLWHVSSTQPQCEYLRG